MGKYRTLLAGLASVAVAFLVGIPFGFRLHAWYPDISDDLLGWGLGMGIPALAVGLMWLLLGRPTLRLALGTQPPVCPSRKAADPDPERAEKIRKMKEEGERLKTIVGQRRCRRLAELRADPGKAAYIPLVERGEEWTDEQIAYRENPKMTATCPHLREVELAIRQSGVEPRLIVQGWLDNPPPSLRIKANCCVDETQLRRDFVLASSVKYDEGYQPERSERDNPYAGLTCSACGSGIGLVHPEAARPTTKWFPVKPV